MATSSTADPPVAEFAGQLFFRLWRASHTQTAAALESIGITTALFSVLNYLLARRSSRRSARRSGSTRARWWR
jgi:hypothetical protein